MSVAKLSKETITPNKIIQDFYITKKGVNGKLRTMNKTELWEVVDEITKKYKGKNHNIFKP